MDILFVCTANVNRSPSAAFWFSLLSPANNYESAGSNIHACRIHKGAYVTESQLEKASRIVCMETRNRKEIESTFGEKYSGKIEIANITDNYKFLDLELIYEFMDKITI